MLNEILTKIDQIDLHRSQQTTSNSKKNDSILNTNSTLNPNATDFVPSFARVQHKSQPLQPKQPIFDINTYLDIEGFDIAADIIRDAESLVNDDNTKKIDNGFMSQLYTDTQNEEEFLEMLEMQDECELEMLKDYYKSQNPELFEEVFYSYNSYPIQTDEFVYFNDMDYVMSQLNPNANEFTPKKFLNSN